MYRSDRVVSERCLSPHPVLLIPSSSSLSHSDRQGDITGLYVPPTTPVLCTACRRTAAKLHRVQRQRDIGVGGSEGRGHLV